jgi:hypothetical protein
MGHLAGTPSFTFGGRNDFAADEPLMGAARFFFGAAIPAISPIRILDAVRSKLVAPTPHESHRIHVASAVEWLERAQDATGTGGFARGYALVRHEYLKVTGWEPAYPETTGYIIPTLYAAADYLGRPELIDRARRAASWEREVQLESGAVQGGVIGQPVAPAVFNTGMVIFGWLCVTERDGDAASADAARRAADFLVDALDDDGVWRRGSSLYAEVHAPLYNARTAWALAEAGVRLGEPRYRDAAARALNAVARRQQKSGWLPDCCLTDPARPLTHTIAYTLRGLLEGGRVLGDQKLIDAASLGAAALAEKVDDRGRLAGRYAVNWKPAVPWSCLTGNAQMAGIWLRLAELTGDRKWIEPVEPVLRFLKCTQNLGSRVDGLRGGILGSSPIAGGYGPNETLNWATKFFIDALIRHDRLRQPVPAPADHALTLA